MQSLAPRLIRGVREQLASSLDANHIADSLRSLARGCVVTQFVSLRPLLAVQEQARTFAAYKKPPTEDDPEDPEDLRRSIQNGHLPRLGASALRNRIAFDATTVATAPRQQKIRDLVRAMANDDETKRATGAFLDIFFAGVHPAMPGSVGADAGPQGIVDDDAINSAAGTFELGTPAPRDDEAEVEVLSELRGLRRGSQRVVLQKLLQGGMLRADPAAMAEWNEIQAAFRPPEGFRMKVVDVNRTCKGTRSGGLYRFSAMVVVGNGEGVLGWGQGKAAEVAAAVRKAYQRACRNLYPIPRYNAHTIPEPATATFGKVKVIMYPKAAGRGTVASSLVTHICKLAGIHDIGVKVHGSRNPRNTVKCLFKAFDEMRTHEEIMTAGDGSSITLALPPGRYGRLNAI